jgi:predicted dehydrogenase
MERFLIPLLLSCAVLFVQACGDTDSDSDTAPAVFTGAPGEVVLMTIDPGHFHAGLVQKVMYGQIAPTAYVFAPDGADVETHLDRIEGFNSRADDPTSWREVVHIGPDYLERMCAERPGNVLVTSGNNRRKTGYIKAAVDTGIHVLADKPMCMDPASFELLKETFGIAGRKGVLLYDIMTERHEITSILQREFAHDAGVFGTFRPGSPDEPSVVKESVHHLFKHVAGAPIKRPGWFFDVDQQGEGLVDITTHLVDLVMWGCFPNEVIDYQADIDVMAANRWPTMVSREEFEVVTRLPEFPESLASQLDDDGVLPCYCNGDITYRIRDLHARVSVIWNYRAPEGGGDTHYSVMRGTKSDIIIRQGAEQDYIPELYVEPGEDVSRTEMESEISRTVAGLQARWPDVGFEPHGPGWRIVIPERYRIGHEAHFGQVMEKYLGYLADGALPDWEVPNMLAKYHTTTSALALAQEK